MWQFGVECPPEHVGRQARPRAESDHLSQGMNAGVRPAAGQHADPLPRDLLDRRFQRPLQRFTPRLDLPARVIRAVVGEGELDGSHAYQSVIRA